MGSAGQDGRHGGSGSGRSRIVSGLALVGLGAVVLAAALLGRLTSVQAAPPTRPPVLDLSTGPLGSTDAAGPSNPAVGPGAGLAPRSGSGPISPTPIIGTGTITVVGKLPAGPSSAPIVRLGPSGPEPEATVRRLAAAFGLTAAPEHTGQSWTVGGQAGQPLLTVNDSTGHLWTYQRADVGCAPIVLPAPRAITQGSRSITCTVANGSAVVSGPGNAAEPMPAGASSGSGSTGSAPPQPSPFPGAEVTIGSVESPAAVLAIAKPVFEAVGLDPAMASAVAGYAHIDPQIDGRQTTGIGTSVVVSGARIVSANGWLSRPSDGAWYPLVSAQAALAALRNRPAPQIAFACPASTVYCRWITQVTGASLGLQLAWDRGTPVLVPTWIYQTGVLLPGQTRYEPGTLTAVAVDPAFLWTTQGSMEPRGTGPDGPGSSGAGGTRSGGVGASPPGDPGDVSPVGPPAGETGMPPGAVPETPGVFAHPVVATSVGGTGASGTG